MFELTFVDFLCAECALPLDGGGFCSTCALDEEAPEFEELDENLEVKTSQTFDDLDQYLEVDSELPF